VIVDHGAGRPFTGDCLTSGCEGRRAPEARWPEYCPACNAKYAAGPICPTPECGYPVVAEDVAFYTERARAKVSAFWHREFAADGNPATPDGLCLECAGNWLAALENFRFENGCSGVCSPYDGCMQCLLDEDEL
jgi:hypothetical protein